MNQGANIAGNIIAYLIWKGSYNQADERLAAEEIIAYLIWKGSYNFW